MKYATTVVLWHIFRPLSIGGNFSTNLIRFF
jgi:hypothetical protein